MRRKLHKVPILRPRAQAGRYVGALTLTARQASEAVSFCLLRSRSLLEDSATCERTARRCRSKVLGKPAIPWRDRRKWAPGPMLYMAVRFCNLSFHQPRTLGTHRDWIASWIMDHAPLAGPSAERICTWRKSNHDFERSTSSLWFFFTLGARKISLFGRR